MDGERYVGERRALRHFLQELRPLVSAELGLDAVLGYRIDRRKIRRVEINLLAAAQPGTPAQLDVELVDQRGSQIP